MKITCIIIDDESHCIDLIREYVSLLPNLILVNTFTDPKEAMDNIIASENVNLIFMDIEMPHISGLELSKIIRHKTDKIIFTTGHTKYAYDAFELEVDAFLLKPFSFSKFSMTISKLFTVSKHDTFIREDYKFFFVKNKEEKNKLTKISYDSIIAVESFGNYVKIYTVQGSVITYLSFDEIKRAILNRPYFTQIHRTFLICTNFIETIDGDLITLHNKIHISIGRSYKNTFTEFMNKTIIKTKRKSIA